MSIDPKDIKRAERRISSGATDGMNCRLCGGGLCGAGIKPTPEEVATNICVACAPIVAAFDWRNPTFMRIAGAIAEQASGLARFCDVTVKVQDDRPVLVEILTKRKPSSDVMRFAAIDTDGNRRDRWTGELIERIGDQPDIRRRIETK